VLRFPLGLESSRCGCLSRGASTFGVGYVCFFLCVVRFHSRVHSVASVCSDPASTQPVPSVSALKCVAPSAVTCAPLDSLLQGTLSYDKASLVPGSVVTYTCESGYVVKASSAITSSSGAGSVKRTCQVDGSWSLPQPSVPGASAVSVGATNAGLQCVAKSDGTLRCFSSVSLRSHGWMFLKLC
jgi:hypothetical protein